MADGKSLSLLSLNYTKDAGENAGDENGGKENHLIALSLASVAANYIEPEILEAHNLEGIPVTFVGPNNEIITASDIAIPPDGGWGWVVVMASFLTNAVIDGMIFSFGLLQDDIQTKYNQDKSEEEKVPTSTVAWIGSLMLGFSLLSGPFCSALANKFGFRPVGMSGCYITAISFLIAISLSKRGTTGEPNILALLIFYGILGGIGVGLIYVPSVITVGFYFEKRRALAVGLAISGTGFGTFIFAPVVKILVSYVRWDGTIVVQACLIFSCSLLTVLYRPLLSPKAQQELEKRVEKVMNVRWYKYPKKYHSKLAKFQNTREEELMFKEECSLSFVLKDFVQDFRSDCFKRKKVREPSIPQARRRRRTTSLGDISRHRSIGDIIRVQSRETLNRPMYRDDIFFSGSLRQMASGTEATTLEIPSTPKPEEPLETVVEEDSQDEPKTQSKHRILEGVKNASQTKIIEGKASLAKEVKTGSTEKLTLEQKKGSHTPIKDQFEIIKDKPQRMSYMSTESIEPITEKHDKLKLRPLAIGPAYKQGCCGPQNVIRKMLDISILKSPTFIVLALGGFLNSLGYIVPFTYLPSFAETSKAKIDKDRAAFLLSIMGISNIVGRILCGYFSDNPKVNTLILNNSALTIAGISTILIPVVQGLGFPVFVIYGIIYGFCMACWVALRSILLVKLLGLGKLTNSFGLLLMFQGIASLIASPLAGVFKDLTNSYDTSFYVGGSLILISALVCYPLGYINRNERASANKAKEKEKNASA